MWWLSTMWGALSPALQPGSYEVKIAVHDEVSGRAGAQQVNLSVETTDEYSVEVRIEDAELFAAQ